MADTPIQLIVAAFKDDKSAKETLKVLKKASSKKLIKIENAAVLHRDQKGKLHIMETQDMGGGKGAAIGGVTGAVIGLIAGATLAVPLTVGALIGGLAAKLRDGGFQDKRLKEIGEGLTPGSSAIVAVVEHTWVKQVKAVIAEAGAQVVTAAISADIAEQLQADHDVAYSVIASQGQLSADRLAGGEDQVDVGQLYVDESGIYRSRFIATKDGFAVKQITATKEGIEGKLADGIDNDSASGDEDK